MKLSAKEFDAMQMGWRKWYIEKVELKTFEKFGLDLLGADILEVGCGNGYAASLIDDEYLFTGDTIWFGADGGYSFISTLAEDNRLAVRSLERLERNIRAREGRIAVITGHTGWTDDLDFAFAHRAEICKPFTKRYSDSEAPYDGYEEAEDTEKGARTVPLSKKKGAGA